MSRERGEQITLIGFMGCGKTSVGKELARMLGIAQLDLDKLIEERAGTTISEIFRTQGEGAFRALESETLRETAARDDALVVCSGGGIVLDPRNSETIRARGTAVWLRATPETIYARISGEGNRPVLKGGMTVERIAEILASRLPRYQDSADFAVDTDGKSIAEIAREIAEKLAEKNR